MNLFNRGGLFFKILSRFLLVALVPLLFVAVVSYYYFSSSLQEQIEGKMIALADGRRVILEQMMDELSTSVTEKAIQPLVISGFTKFQTIFNDSGIASQAYRLFSAQYKEGFQRTIDVNRYIYDIIFVASDGDIIFSLKDESDLGSNIHGSHLKNTILTELIDSVGYSLSTSISDFAFYPPSNQPALFIASPVYGQNKLLGTLVFQIKPTMLYDFAQDYSRLSRTSDIILAKRSGNEIIYTVPSRFKPDIALKYKVDVGANSFLPSAKALQGETGVGLAVDLRGKEVLARWQYIPQLNLGLVVKADKDDIFWPVYQLGLFYLIVLSLVICLIVGGTNFLARSISGPIEKIRHGLKIIGLGNLDYKFELARADELGELADEVEKMAGSLKQSARYARSLLEASLDPLVTINAEGKITDVNEAAVKATGQPREAMIGTDFSSYFTEPTKARQGYEEVFAKGFVTDYPLILRHKDGRETDVLYNAAVYKDGQGQTLGIFAAARDVTERNRQARELQEKYDELQKAQTAMLYMVEDLNRQAKELREAQDSLVRSEKLATIGQLASSVAHEIRNPLGVIKNALYYLNMLELGKDNADVAENLAIMAKEIDNSDRIINDLLEFSRIKKPTLRPENINLIVKEVLRRLKISPNIEVITQLAENLPETAADALQIQQVFYNLANNALQSMIPEGEPEKAKGGKLTIKTQAAGDQLAISFTDTGSGIAPDNLKKIFNPLFSTKAKGTGLGLSVCQSIVEGHQGKINIESAVGKGTTFTVILPIRGG